MEKVKAVKAVKTVETIKTTLDIKWAMAKLFINKPYFKRG